jgi:hypothetical protein
MVVEVRVKMCCAEIQGFTVFSIVPPINVWIDTLIKEGNLVDQIQGDAIKGELSLPKLTST